MTSLTALIMTSLTAIVTSVSVLLQFALASQLSVDALPERQYLQRGQPGKLDCPLILTSNDSDDVIMRGSPVYVEWRKDDRWLDVTDSAGRVTVDDSGSLILRVVQPTDAGRYVCVGPNTRRSDIIHVAVTGEYILFLVRLVYLFLFYWI